MPRTGEKDQVDAFVGARIGLRRAAMGLSQTALAQRIGISFQQVQKYETGQNRISASRLHRVATVLGASVESFFPPTATIGPGEADEWVRLRQIAASSEGRAVVSAFPMIEDRALRQAVARIVRALSRDG